MLRINVHNVSPLLIGPAKYYILENKPQKGKFVYQSERFKETEKEQLPGPADYEVMIIKQFSSWYTSMNRNFSFLSFMA